MTPDEILNQIEMPQIGFPVNTKRYGWAERIGCYCSVCESRPTDIIRVQRSNGDKLHVWVRDIIS